MKLLALDQASGTTGYAIFDEQTLVTSGTFTTSSSGNTKVGKFKSEKENGANGDSLALVSLD